MEVQINFIAAIAAAVSTFLIGSVWYSPLMFEKAWRKENGFTEEDTKNVNLGKVFGGSFLLALIMSFNLAAFLGPEADLSFGLFAGFAAGLGWVAPAFGVIYLFEKKSLKLFLINAGYWVISFTLMGAILGLWR